MPMQFQVLRDRPDVSIKVTRDSVCAGDDCHAPHEKMVKMPTFTDPHVFTSHLSSSYLPSVAGIGHTWDCLLNGNLVGSISTKGFQPKVHEIEYADENHVHFSYHSAAY